LFIRYVGLDVHKDSIKIAVADAGQDRARYFSSIPNDSNKLLQRLHKIGSKDSIQCCYEAGPGGYTLHRALSSADIDCRVIAPSLIPKQSGRRIKTDRLDAENLAHYLRSGDLVEVWVPDEKTESMRNLVRLREDARISRHKSRQHLNQFLLRKGRIYPRPSRWIKSHMLWVRQQHFEEAADEITLKDYLRTVELADSRIENIEEDIRLQCRGWTLNPLVRNLQALHGIGFLSAVVIAAETGDLRRFGSAGKLMSYYGLVPSEHSSGSKEKRGSITRCGNSFVRRILVEAAWHYRHQPNNSRALKSRSEGLSQKVLDIGWKAQKRLHRKYMKLLMSGKLKNKVCVAVARELTGFVWAIGREVY